MHREFDPAAEPFEHRSATPLFAFTALLIALLIADLWPLLANWLDLPTWANREMFGVRFALIAAVLGGARALFTSLEHAAEGRVGADLAIAIACVAAILIGEPLVAAEVIVIGLIGECLEAATFNRTHRALRSLAELFPTRVWVLRDGIETRVFTSQISVGDTVVVKPGGKIPVDGVVLAGTSTIDTSALTGESIPQDRTVGDMVLAGSVNQFGALTIRADKVAKQTVAGRVIELTAQALKDKAPVERYADRLARRFLPVVLGLAALAFVFNLTLLLGPWAAEPKPGWSAAARAAFYPTLAVLVVACPCPLVLATPAAVIAALGRLAGTGILLKGGAALERLAEVRHVAFDKTGTLTTGELELGDVSPIDCSENELIRAAAIAEQNSEHPLAKLILSTAQARNLSLEPLDAFEAHPGGGVSASARGSRYLVGNRRLLEANGIPVPPDTHAQTTLFVAKDRVLLGAVSARDTLRPEAAGVVDDLKSLNLGVSLLTGDRAAVAADIAARAGIAEVHADLLPADKARLLDKGHAFVGDGVNDAPALAQAAVGIAVGSGTEIAAETGDVILMGDPLRPLPLLIRLSRQALAIIRQNIIWFGFGVNLIGVIIAGFLWPLVAPRGAWLEGAPLFGVIYHQIGSLLVLLNSMRLLSFERPAANRIRSLVHDADRWLNTLHIDDALHALGHRWKPLTAGAAALALIAWLGSGITQINANEVGIVQRFGALHNNLTPGLHLRWPWPIETIAILQPAEARTLTIGFRPLASDAAARLREARAEQEKLRRGTGDQTWASGHAGEIHRIADESLVLTGDGNLVEILATLRYSIADPREFLFASSDVENLLRSVVESSLRDLAAGARFEDLLTVDRPAFEAKAFACVQSRLPPQLGVRLDGLVLHDLHPPQEVVAAYHAVAEAIQRRDRAINDAESEATRVRRRAADSALYLVRIAEADGFNRISEALAARDTFLAWHAARSSLTAAEEKVFAEELAARSSRGEDRAAVEREITAKKQQTLAARKMLIDLRLTLRAATAALAGRDKIFLDAENVPGRRTLLLADPEAFRLPVFTKPEENPR